MSPTYEIVQACPACGGTTLRPIADGEDVRRQVEFLWSFHTRRVHGDTPPTRLLDRSAFSQRPPLAIVACTRCGTLMRNPRERPETLRDLYVEDAPDESARMALLRTQRATYAAQAKRLTRVLGRTGRVLEVGCYLGGFLEAAHACGWQAEGVDVNPDAVGFARARGLRVELGELSAIAPDRRYDAIVFWNVFEQLDDPAAALAAAHDRLAANGVIALRIPNGAFYRRLVGSPAPVRPAAYALLAWNNLLAFPYRHGFTSAAVAALCARERLRVVHTHGDALARISDASTRRWARLEEAAVKALLRRALRRSAPWLELYAR